MVLFLIQKKTTLCKVSFPPTYIYQHRKENKKKCTLQPIRNREGVIFFTYPQQDLPSLSNHIVLRIDAPPLSIDDKDKGILLIDGTWRYAGKMLQKIESTQSCEYRSIPKGFQTAYPRKQEDCSEPEKGLASIEALYIAYSILGRSTERLLEAYHFRKNFLKKNNKKLFF